jgi:hypothetical protein
MTLCGNGSVWGRLYRCGGQLSVSVEDNSLWLNTARVRRRTSSELPPETRCGCRAQPRVIDSHESPSSYRISPETRCLPGYSLRSSSLPRRFVSPETWCRLNTKAKTRPLVLSETWCVVSPHSRGSRLEAWVEERAEAWTGGCDETTTRERRSEDETPLSRSDDADRRSESSIVRPRGAEAKYLPRPYCSSWLHITVGRMTRRRPTHGAHSGMSRLVNPGDTPSPTTSGDDFDRQGGTSRSQYSPRRFESGSCAGTRLMAGASRSSRTVSDSSSSWATPRPVLPSSSLAGQRSTLGRWLARRTAGPTTTFTPSNSVPT